MPALAPAPIPAPTTRDLEANHASATTTWWSRQKAKRWSSSQACEYFCWGLTFLVAIVIILTAVLASINASKKKYT